MRFAWSQRGGRPRRPGAAAGRGAFHFVRNLTILWVFLLSAMITLAIPRVCQKCGYESDNAVSACTHCGAALPVPAAEDTNAPARPVNPAGGDRHSLTGSMVEQDLAMARQYLATNRADVAKLFLRNALALDMVASDVSAGRTAAIAELLKQCEFRNGTVRSKCAACEGSGKRIMRSTLLSGKTVDISTGGMPCPQCGGSGVVFRAGTVADMKLALSRAMSRYRVLQQGRRYAEVGGAWVPEDTLGQLSLRDRVTLRRALADPCGTCMGIGQADCATCSGTGRIKCPNRGCVGGSITVSPAEKWGRRLEHTEKCKVCGGTGVVPCEKCRATGAILCKTCNGTGERPVCQRCGGEGVIPCRRCGAAGQKAGSNCTVCGGAGETICTACQGDGKKR